MYLLGGKGAASGRGQHPMHALLEVMRTGSAPLAKQAGSKHFWQLGCPAVGSLSEGDFP